MNPITIGRNQISKHFTLAECDVYFCIDIMHTSTVAATTKPQSSRAKKKSHSIHIHTKKNRKENLSKSFFFCAKYIAEFQIMEFFMMAKKIQYFFSLALHSLRPPRYSHEAYVIQQIASWGFAAYVMINNWTFFDGLQRANKPTNKIFSFFCFLSESCYCFFLIKMCACWCVSVFCHRLITA